MKRFIPYIAFACLSSFTAINGLPVIAKGCSSHLNKNKEINCSKDDIDCQSEQVENFESINTLRS